MQEINTENEPIEMQKDDKKVILNEESIYSNTNKRACFIAKLPKERTLKLHTQVRKK